MIALFAHSLHFQARSLTSLTPSRTVKFIDMCSCCKRVQRPTSIERLAGLFLERAREPLALYFAAGLSGFAGSEPGWLSQNWNHVLNSNGLRDSCKIIRRKHKLRETTIVISSNVNLSTSKASHFFMWWFLLSLSPIYFYHERDVRLPLKDDSVMRLIHF